jgi:hypothetical protein
MVPQTTVSRIFVLLIPTIVLAIVNSYVPHDLTLIRQTLSYVQLGFMAIIVIVAIQYVLEDF